jgi:hypothetical protein
MEQGRHTNAVTEYVKLLGCGKPIVFAKKGTQTVNMAVARSMPKEHREEWLRKSLGYVEELNGRVAAFRVVAGECGVDTSKLRTSGWWKKLTYVAVYNLSEDDGLRGLALARWSALVSKEHNERLLSYHEAQRRRMAGEPILAGDPPRMEAMPMWKDALADRAGIGAAESEAKEDD